MAIVVALDDPTALDQAADALDGGEVIVLPTDTVYGLAARPSEASASIFRIKGRSADVPLAVLVADEAQGLALFDGLPGWIVEVVARTWPGPLTVVGRRRADVRFELGQPSDTIGVRCPDHAFVQDLARRVGPLATTSANRHGSPTPARAEQVVGQLGGQLPPSTLVIDGGTCTGAPSTVVDVSGDGPVIVREGPVDLSPWVTPDG